jgi:hypothetical protein
VRLPIARGEVAAMQEEHVLPFESPSATHPYRPWTAARRRPRSRTCVPGRDRRSLRARCRAAPRHAPRLASPSEEKREAGRYHRRFSHPFSHCTSRLIRPLAAAQAKGRRAAKT